MKNQKKKLSIHKYADEINNIKLSNVNKQVQKVCEESNERKKN